MQADAWLWKTGAKPRFYEVDHAFSVIALTSAVSKGDIDREIDWEHVTW